MCIYIYIYIHIHTHVYCEVTATTETRILQIYRLRNRRLTKFRSNETSAAKKDQASKHTDLLSAKSIRRVLISATATGVCEDRHSFSESHYPAIQQKRRLPGP